MGGSELRIVLALGTTQTLAWASSYYLPAILADSIARDLGVSSNWVFGAFSGALVVSALIGPRVGRQIDAVGGRPLLSISSVVFALGLALLGASANVVSLAAAWLVLGAGMGMGLYDAAFATLGRIYGNSARRAITGITLIAGFASTVGWPLSAWGLDTIGWRNTCFAWAAAHLVLGLPLNLLFLPSTPSHTSRAEDLASPAHVAIDRNMILLAVAFASAWTVTSAIAAHLPRMLEAAGATAVQAVAAGALIGPAQVAARVFEAGLMKRFHPLVSARLSCVTHPMGVVVLLASGGGVAASAFALLHGAGNGILTIARGTLPLAIFGPVNYGYRLGILGAPSRMTQALAPLAFGFLLEALGQRVFLVSSALSLVALGALFALRRTAPP